MDAWVDYEVDKISDRICERDGRENHVREPEKSGFWGALKDLIPDPEKSGFWTNFKNLKSAYEDVRLGLVGYLDYKYCGGYLNADFSNYDPISSSLNFITAMGGHPDTSEDLQARYSPYVLGSMSFRSHMHLCELPLPGSLRILPIKSVYKGITAQIPKGIGFTPKIPLGDSTAGMIHILERHAFNTTHKNVSKFCEGHGANEIAGMIYNAVSKGNKWNVAKNGYRTTNVDMGYIVGINKQGISTRVLKIVVDDYGSVVTAYPFK